MKTIRFLTGCILRDARVGTPDEERYDAGQIVTLRDDAALRWLRRGKAVEVAEAVPPLPEAGAPLSQPALVVGSAAVDQDPPPAPLPFADPATPDGPKDGPPSARRGRYRKE